MLPAGERLFPEVDAPPRALPPVADAFELLAVKHTSDSFSSAALTEVLAGCCCCDCCCGPAGTG